MNCGVSLERVGTNFVVVNIALNKWAPTRKATYVTSALKIECYECYEGKGYSVSGPALIQ